MELQFSIDKVPYYAIKYNLETMGTFGGVKTDDTYRVINKKVH